MAVTYSRLSSVQRVELAGEEMVARPDRTLFWPRRKTLFLADLHLGKGAAFRAGGIPLPEGSTSATLAKLTAAVEATEPDRIVMLGDLWHAATGRDAGTTHRFCEWLHDHRSREIILIVGNHDVSSGTLEQDHLRVEPEGLIDAPFVLAHHPQKSEAGYVLCGHLHPAATLTGPARQSYSLRCFWLRPQYAVLPSFGALTGANPVTCTQSDRVLVIAGGKVWEV